MLRVRPLASHEPPLLHRREALVGHGRLDAPLIAEQRVGSEVARVTSPPFANLLGTRQGPVHLDHPHDRIDLRVADFGRSPHASDGQAMPPRTFDYLVARTARGVRVIENPA